MDMIQTFFLACVWALFMLVDVQAETCKLGEECVVDSRCGCTIGKCMEILQTPGLFACVDKDDQRNYNGLVCDNGCTCVSGVCLKDDITMCGGATVCAEEEEEGADALVEAEE